MARFYIAENSFDGEIRFKGSISRRDIESLDLSPLERAAMHQPNLKTDPLWSANNLLILEMLFRRLAEKEPRRSGVRVESNPPETTAMDRHSV